MYISEHLVSVVSKQRFHWIVLYIGTYIITKLHRKAFEIMKNEICVLLHIILPVMITVFSDHMRSTNNNKSATPGWKTTTTSGERISTTALLTYIMFPLVIIMLLVLLVATFAMIMPWMRVKLTNRNATSPYAKYNNESNSSQIDFHTVK